MKYIKSLFFVAIICSIFSCDQKETITDVTQFPRMKVLSTQVSEAESSVNVTVQLTWAYNQTVSVDYRTIPSDNAEATLGEDYESASGTLTFIPGETEKTLSVSLLDDILNETTETFIVELSNPVLAKLLVANAVVEIIDNDDDFFIDGSGYEAPEQYQGFTRVWEDDFDGTEINEANWTHEVNGDGGGNNELQFYTDRPSNSLVTSGFLVIEAKEELFNGRDYTSARLVSKGKQEFKYGRIDIRAKMPEGKGLWPALWMLGDNIDQVSWPRCGEIDIMELVGNSPQITHGTIHYPDPNGAHLFKGSSTFLTGGKKFIDEFHVFSIIWKEDKIEWLLDGKKFYELTPALIDPGVWSFNNEFFFILNVAVGGNWPGSPNATTVFPQRMIVDYVRVYQL